jgi:hypothetical protein
MAVSGISTSSVNSYQPNDQQQSRQQFTLLVKALQSGDLSGAQQAYSALTQSQGNGSAPSDPNSPFAQALSKIGQALKSGDLTGAQQALSALQQQLQQAQGTHHHHHHGHHAAKSAPSTPSPSSSSGSADSASSTLVGATNITA